MKTLTIILLLSMISISNAQESPTALPEAIASLDEDYEFVKTIQMEENEFSHNRLNGEFVLVGSTVATNQEAVYVSYTQTVISYELPDLKRKAILQIKPKESFIKPSYGYEGIGFTQYKKPYWTIRGIECTNHPFISLFVFVEKTLNTESFERVFEIYWIRKK